MDGAGSSEWTRASEESVEVQLFLEDAENAVGRLRIIADPRFLEVGLRPWRWVSDGVVPEECLLCRREEERARG